MAARINPKTDGRPDSRPFVAENAKHPRQPREGLRLQPEAAEAAHPAAPPAVLVGRSRYGGRMAAPVARGDEVELDVESLAFGGNGVARLDGFVVFVRSGLPGDRVRARVTKVKRRHAEALATEILQPGPQLASRRRARTSRSCGGCRFQDLAYDAQLAQKAGAGARLARAARRDRRAAARADRPVRAGDLPLPQQARVLVHADGPTGPRSASTARAAGTRCSRSSAAGSSTTSATRIRDAVRDWAREEGLPAYSQEDGSGYLRHLVVRAGRNTGQALVQLVTAPGEKFEPRLLRRRACGRFPEVRSIHWAVNDTPAEVTNLPTKLLWGERVDRGGALRPALPRPPERVPADEHGDGRAALRARARRGRADRHRDRLGPLLRDRDDRPLARRATR